MGLLNVVLFAANSTTRFNYKIRKSWFPECMDFVKGFLQKSNGSDWAPFCFVFLAAIGGGVWFGRVVLRGRFFFRVTQGIWVGCMFFIEC